MIQPFDIQVGKTIRTLRCSKGLSQKALATGCGVTYQMIQKYERGKNRISAGRLKQIADILDVPIGRLFET